MQKTQGNRAVQRMLHGAAHSRTVVGPEGGQLSDEVTNRIELLRGTGAPLGGDLRVEMESAFGQSLDEVRIHEGEEADTLNRSMGAKAFTTGSDIFFRGGAGPGDSRLLAHELTHVIQQRGAGESGPLTVGPSDDTHEQEAHSVAESVSAGSAAQVHTASGPTIARDLLDGLTIGDWKFKPTVTGSTDDRYDTPENKRRAEMKDADARSNDPTPPKWWEKPKYDPSAPLPWMPKMTPTQPDTTVPPLQSPDEGPGDYPMLPEDEAYA